MSWCSGTAVFDVICEAVFTQKHIDKDKIEESKISSVDIKSILKKVIIELEAMDWDCQQESDFWDIPIVQEIFKELHPDWFKKE